jgi:predicted nucleic acid-binding protein
MGALLPPIGSVAVAEIIDYEINISVINKIELLGFSDIGQGIVDFVRLANVFPLNDDVVEKSITIRQKHKIKLPDAIIAATCLVYDFTLLTRNVIDFKNVENLIIINPWDL